MTAATGGILHEKPSLNQPRPVGGSDTCAYYVMTYHDIDSKPLPLGGGGYKQGVSYSLIDIA